MKLGRTQQALKPHQAGIRRRLVSGNSADLPADEESGSGGGRLSTARSGISDPKQTLSGLRS
jgi:hypothetical protein